MYVCMYIAYYNISTFCVQASKNCLDCLIEQGGTHYVLLSAICVQKPLLEFQAR